MHSTKKLKEKNDYLHSHLSPGVGTHSWIQGKSEKLMYAKDTICILYFLRMRQDIVQAAF
jgi:hypothetical protein